MMTSAALPACSRTAGIPPRHSGSKTAMQPRGGNADIEAALGAFFLVLIVILVVALIIMIFYLLTLQKALSRVAPHNRLMQPGHVWFMLVPCVNIIYQFVVATRLPDSLRNEF